MSLAFGVGPGRQNDEIGVAVSVEVTNSQVSTEEGAILIGISATLVNFFYNAGA